ncbi:MAG: PAS domain-containing protein [Desulfarculaceae bacterium]|nr:PAS domain-containing protein [Desulfarculaceae bacterium]MCF8048159.1 PAS domain-containing protein [Desulfarculaceae bacterium]MCF8065289.1 PAS domain-containing protein [Desulfarculaceae bacterium]MCF8098818.1 PAS domain-containing protein [Desulfarculaceae bacterium]MCF8123546.1 PAS domain-containing protein [Desulfarculaceae bacterium]
MQENTSLINQMSFSHTVYNAVPSPILVVNEDVRIIDHNQAAGAILAPQSQAVLRRRAGEVLHCLNANRTPEGCGRSEPCRECVIRGSVNRCLATGTLTRQKARLELADGEKVNEVHFLVSAAPLKHQEQKLVVLILEDIGEIVELRRMLPICARCKNVRDKEDLWQRVDLYLSKHMDLDFTHSLCPDCAAELYPHLMGDKADKPN